MYINQSNKKMCVKRTSIYISLQKKICDRVPRHRCSDTGGGNATRGIKNNRGKITRMQTTMQT